MQIGALPDDTTPWMMVVGVVGNVKQPLVTDMATEMYVPYRQANEVLPVRTMSVVMRSESTRACLFRICGTPYAESIPISR
jgi:hypothetical protein